MAEPEVVLYEPPDVPWRESKNVKDRTGAWPSQLPDWAYEIYRGAVGPPPQLHTGATMGELLDNWSAAYPLDQGPLGQAVGSRELDYMAEVYRQLKMQRAAERMAAGGLLGGR